MLLTSSQIFSRRVATASLKHTPKALSLSSHLNTSIYSKRNGKKYQLFSTDALESPRESMAYDVLIVGAGPAGLGAAIRLKQLAKSSNKDLSVCLIEKGSEVGSHILSGNVFDPRALKELFGDDVLTNDEMTEVLNTPVMEDSFLIMNENSAFGVPNFLLPSQLHNAGKSYVISLSQLCRKLGEKAEELGVEIYPGFSAAEVLYREKDGGVYGIATRDMGIGKDGKPKDTFERGMELHARQTLFAEGARGSCSEEIITKFDLRKGKDQQTYGLGVKEVWEVPEDIHQPGFVQHTLGWPLQSSFLKRQTFGGGFVYHEKQNSGTNLVHVGCVIGLDYENPYLNPYKEFQRWKTHPEIRKNIEHNDSSCISYGARVLNEGGYHAIPKLTFPGGALIGCSAGFLNAIKIKGSHTAMKSGMVAAEALHAKLTMNDSYIVNDTGEINTDEGSVEIYEYEEHMRTSWVERELREVRNCHAAFHYGFLPGLIYSGLSAHVLKGREPWAFKNSKPDSDHTLDAEQCKDIEYPTPDGVLTFDLLTNLQRSGTYHDDDQPAHLKVKSGLLNVPKDVSRQVFAAPETRFCPAGVYEYVEDDNSENNLVINAQNCIHCKCCSIKMPHEYINWTVPEGGGGPQYQVM